jgi:nucleotide-binding universal stress UspA family protein
VLVMTGTGAVIVAVDDSASARHAAGWAADLAAVWRARLELVHSVLGWPDDEPLPDLPIWLRELADSAEREGVSEVVPQAVPGGILETLVARAHRARLLVVGSYGEGAWTGMLAGPVAIGLIDRTTCPVAVIRGSAPEIPPPRRGPVLVGTDGSLAAGVAVDLAADVARSLGAALVAVVAMEAGAGPTADRVADQLTVVRARHPALPVEERIVEGHPLQGLGRLAQGARLLVIGRHRTGAEPDVTLGVTAHQLVESAPCPILVAASPSHSATEPAVEPEPAVG